ncbi:MAG: leucine-rich repeat domain-containing protein, partial [Muribaculaceae bacterium]|nr:leucine-rich repeat domain-containing protein [Muribaculaceae bacterium]
VDMEASGIKTVPQMFSGCSSLAEVLLPRNAEVIGLNAFQDLTSLKQIAFPSTLKTIEALAFLRSGLEAITIPYSVSRIDESAFKDCKAITLCIESYPATDVEPAAADGESDVQPGANEELLTIGKQAFNTATMTGGVTCHRFKVPVIADDTFSAATYKNKLYVPWGMADAYYQVDENGKPYGWGKFGSEITGLDGIEAEGAVSVSVSGGVLRVRGCGGETVNVYGVDGRRVYCGAEGEISLPGGIYIVTAGSYVTKVML